MSTFSSDPLSFFLWVRNEKGLRELVFELTISDRRYDRGTGAMHLANTPVVSPETKNPAVAGFSLCSNCSLFVAAIVAQLCQAWINYLIFWPVFNTIIKKIASIAKKWFQWVYSDNSLRASKKTFALNISRHQRTRFLASPSVNHGAIACNSRVMSEIFFRVV